MIHWLCEHCRFFDRQCEYNGPIPCKDVVEQMRYEEFSEKWGSRLTEQIKKIVTLEKLLK
jgi:hypothetical protein